MQKIRPKYGVILVAVAAIVVLGLVGVKGYRWMVKKASQTDETAFVPEVPDLKHYATMKERAAAALAVARRQGLREDYCLLVDYSLPSGEPRLTVWSYAENKVVDRTYVMHGYGHGGTKEQPQFSNLLGSRCSALGHMAVTHKHGQRVKRSYKLRGLDTDNLTVWDRGLMIHPAPWVDMHCFKEYIPLHEKSCEGCVTITTRGMECIERIMEQQEGEMLLWCYN